MALVLAGLVTFVCACGRVNFEPLLASDAGSGIDSAASCVPLWLNQTMPSPPVPLANVNSASNDQNPFVTDDGQTLYFASTRTDPLQDVYTATRIGASFGSVTPASEFTTTGRDSHVAISADGLTAFHSTDRVGAGAMMMNLWLATRAATSDPFSNFTAAPFGNVNSNISEFEPFPSRDLLRLYWTRSVVILFASRANVTDPFDAGAVVAELESPASECCASLSDDERVIVFVSNRGGSLDLYYATRASIADAFSPPQPVPQVNDATAVDYHSFLTPDACTIYFASDRPGGLGNYDIWVSSVQ